MVKNIYPHFSFPLSPCGVFVFVVLHLSVSFLPAQDTVPVPPSATEMPADPAVVQTVKEEEMRRTERNTQINQAVDAGAIFFRAGDLDKAEARYQFALANTAASGPGKSAYDRAQAGLAQVKLARAVAARQGGKYEDAANFLAQAKELDTQNLEIDKEAIELKRARDRFARQRINPESVENNPAVTTEFIEKVANVQRLLFEGDSFFETGQYDKADQRYRQALVLDEYNKAARQRLDRLDRYKLRVAKIAHENARDQALYDVTRRWHQVEKQDDTSASARPETTTTESNVARLTNKLASIRIPSIAFNETPVDEAVKFLMAKSRELDPTGEGVNLVPKLEVTALPPAPITGAATAAAGTAPAPASIARTVSFTSTNATLEDALRLLTSLTNLKYKVEEYAVLILPLTEESEVFVTRTFVVPPGFFTGGLTSGAPRANAGAGAANATTVDAVKVDVKKQLSDQGVVFPNGATAAFLSGSSKLVVKNTPEQMDIIDSLIQARMVEEPQIEIETKFAEFSDDALKQLSFNWGLNFNGAVNEIPFLENANGTLQAASTNSGYIPSFLNLPLSQKAIDNHSRQTAGATALRNQSSLNQQTVDNLLSSASTLDRGSKLFVGAVVAGKAFGVIADLVDQLTGVDLVAAPKITTKNRSNASIKIVRQMRYPSNFEQPKFNPTQALFDSNPIVVIAPPTPSEFQTENVGVTLDVTATAYPDRRIDLELKPVLRDFEGFIDYGATISQGSILTNDILTVITYKIQQPVFNVRSIVTKMQVIDGQTIIMGGLVREDRQKIEDKVPLLGDLPAVGRFFRSTVEKTTKKNLILFVTARIMRANGKPKFDQQLVEAAPVSATATTK